MPSPSHHPFGEPDLYREAAADIKGHTASFNLRWSAQMRAINRWQIANPSNDLTWPDHADLVVWLMEQHDATIKVVSDIYRKVMAASVDGRGRIECLSQADTDRLRAISRLP